MTFLKCLSIVYLDLFWFVDSGAKKKAFIRQNFDPLSNLRFDIKNDQFMWGRKEDDKSSRFNS